MRALTVKEMLYTSKQQVLYDVLLFCKIIARDHDVHVNGYSRDNLAISKPLIPSSWAMLSSREDS